MSACLIWEDLQATDEQTFLVTSRSTFYNRQPSPLQILKHRMRTLMKSLNQGHACLMKTPKGCVEERANINAAATGDDFPLVIAVKQKRTLLVRRLFEL